MNTNNNTMVLSDALNTSNEIQGTSKVIQQEASNLPSYTDRLIGKLVRRPGQIVTVRSRRTMKTRAGVAAIVEKVSTFQARVGVNYDNIQRVKDARTVGNLPSESQGLPWGKCTLFPYLIEHNGKRYFRFTKAHSNYTPTVKYLVNGKPATKEMIEPMVLASELRDRSESDKDGTQEVFVLPVNAIKAVK